MMVFYSSEDADLLLLQMLSIQGKGKRIRITLDNGSVYTGTLLQAIQNIQKSIYSKFVFRDGRVIYLNQIARLDESS